MWQNSFAYRIDPTNWYVGMKNPKLQLMVYGEGIRNAEVTTDYEGVRIEDVVRLKSPNYLLVYLDIANAKAGEMTLSFKIGKKTVKQKYELKEREMAGKDRKGFTNADVLYMLMPDRFASAPLTATTAKAKSKKKAPVSEASASDKRRIDRTKPSLRHGGNLEGIRQNLDYFNKLGVTALWFTPVLENNSPDAGEQSTYHGYATTDYYRVDPFFGTNEQYRQLCDEAHQKGLKIVMDMIFNHCGFDHPWVADMPSDDWFNTPEWLSPEAQATNKENASEQKNPEGQSVMATPPTNEQYVQTNYKLTPVLDPYASKIDLKETTEGWFVPSMPDLNQRNPHVMRYLIQNSFWWIETVGIDGIRMDTYPYAFKEGMARWMKELLEEYPNYNVVGETWVTEPAYTAAWQKDFVKDSSNRVEARKETNTQQLINSNLPTVMDFAFYEKIGAATKYEETDAWWNGFNKIYNNLVYDYLYPNPSSVMAFLDNHDTDRFLGKTKDTLALKQALSVLLTIKRIPQLYYGTEILMNGTKEITDGYVRNDFPGGWAGDTKNAFTQEGMTQSEKAMFRWVSKLLHWRQGNDVIIKGKQTQWCPVDGVYVINRHYNGKSVLVVLNGTKSEATFQAKRYAEAVPSGTVAKDVTSGRKYNISEDFKLKPRQSLILEY
ncbi:MAG: alpha-amylase family glycosyl hydrolase [Bacteroidaceae bacterium]|nr:alpha-amylase family glycosyl hydrolase [Bacteroidaceae bacterium]